MTISSHRLLLSLLLITFLVEFSCCKKGISKRSIHMDCKNGGTYDRYQSICMCTPFYHGRWCEHSFITFNPCTNISSLPVLTDENAVHRLGNTQDCRLDRTCMDFSQIPESWYRVKSDAGSYLVDRCPTTATACGSRNAVILTNVTREDNNNMILSSAKAYVFDRSRVGQTPCYYTYDVGYPVRILQCSAGQKLYYLRNLPGMRMHYCIGDKERCQSGSRSVANNGFAPCVSTDRCVPSTIPNARRPQLSIEYLPSLLRDRGNLRSKFICTAYATHRHDAGVLYTMQWSLTLNNGTSMIIASNYCRNESIQINENGNATMRCLFEDLFDRSLYAYGGTLTCEILAKCNTESAEYNTAPVVSNSHSLSFDFFYKSNKSVITPGDQIELCINVTRFPPFRNAWFYFTVARQRIIPRDQIAINFVNRRSNESSNSTSQCGIQLNGQKVICRQMILRNHDPDGQYPLGLTKEQQISGLKINVSFASISNGVNTKMKERQIQRVELTVDLRRLQKQPVSYMHIYTDPAVKNAHKDYSRTFFVSEKNGMTGYRIAMRHLLLPYEFQIKFQGSRSFTTGVALRYEYYVIHIYGETNNPSLQVKVESRLPRNIYRHVIPQKPDSMPQGVKLTLNGLKLKLELELYGTIMFVYAFGFPKHQCKVDFLINSEKLSQPSCGGGLNIDNRRTIDVMITPGFYDTEEAVTGLMFGKDSRPEADRNLFDLENLNLPTLTESVRQDTDVLSVCSCEGKTYDEGGSQCSVDFDDSFSVSRTKRQAADTINVMAVRNDVNNENISSSEAALWSLNITMLDAADFCNRFADLKAKSSVSTGVCGQTKDLVGGSDYMTQFKSACVQYAVVLGTYIHTNSLFQSFLGKCYRDMTLNAEVVQQNQSKIETVIEDLCKDNCSGNGKCLSGECSCFEGFTGSACELSIEKMKSEPIRINMMGNYSFCSSADCKALLFELTSFLKSNDASCIIRDTNSSSNQSDLSVPSLIIDERTVSCDVKPSIEKLQQESIVYIAVEVKLAGTGWESENSEVAVLHQDRCFGQPTVCNIETHSCVARPLMMRQQQQQWHENYCGPEPVVTASASSTITTRSSSHWFVTACIAAMCRLLHMV